MATERQQAADLSGIRADHRARYELAATIVGGSVIDAACGCGYGSAILADAGCRVRGVDVSEEAIAWAQAHYQRPGIVYTRADAAIVSGSYDWAVCFETLEHVEDDGALLRALAQRAPRLLLSVPNQDEVPFKRERNPFHVRHYRLGELEALLRGAGWRLRRRWGQPVLGTDFIADAGGGTFICECSR